MKTVKLTQEFPVSPHILYAAWLNSKTHSEMTGGEAHCSDAEGEKFTAWDGYIEGTNISLNLPKEIIQKWRTADFKDSDPDSTIKIEFEETPNGCLMTLTHSEIPEGQPDYHQGWIDNYLEPMKDHFRRSGL
ncbi:MAG: SRPBCC domain-containing protein [Cyclobacteriaceae bacterium]